MKTRMHIMQTLIHLVQSNSIPSIPPYSINKLEFWATQPGTNRRHVAAHIDICDKHNSTQSSLDTWCLMLKFCIAMHIMAKFVRAKQKLFQWMNRIHFVNTCPYCHCCCYSSTASRAATMIVVTGVVMGMKTYADISSILYNSPRRRRRNEFRKGKC